MSSVNLLTMIIPRQLDGDYARMFEEIGQKTAFSLPAVGTAKKSILDMLGLEENEKTVIFTLAGRKTASHIMQQAIFRMGLDIPGNGIALTIPLDAIGGAGSMRELLSEKPIEKEEKDMDEKHEFPCALLIVICERGYSEDVMDAARGAGARGGTVLHARGTAGQNAEKFFGVSLAPEKEMLMIVVNQRDKVAVMRAIMEQTGISTPAHAILFALPVEDVAGLHSVMEAAQEEKDEQDSQ